MSINVLKDIAEALSLTADVLSGLTDAITNMVTAGHRGYTYISAQRDYSRLKDLSVRLEVLRSFSNKRAVQSIDEYLAMQCPSILDWNAVIDGINSALEEGHSILVDIRKERSDFVLEHSFSKLTSTISTRQDLLNKLKGLEPPANELEINQLKEINKSYKKIIAQLKSVTKELNAYLSSCSA